MKILALLLLFMHVPQNIQSPYVEADFWAQWSSVNPRMALFIQVTPQTFWTGVSAVGFTSNTRDMELPGRPGVTFHASPGITPTLADQVLGDAGAIEMTGIYQSGIFEREDVLAGKWNFATVEVFSACWDNTDLGEFVHFKGNLGEFKDYQQYFTGEGRGMIDRLSNDVNTVTQRLCRVKQFGNTQCGKSLAGTITVDSKAYNLQQVGVPGIPGLGRSIVLDVADLSAPIPSGLSEFDNYADLWRNGTITAVTGANAGVSREISIAIGSDPNILISLKRLFPYDPQSGDTYTITMGCTRTIEDCRKFANAANFRGEPWVPGIESANRINAGS